MRRHRNRRNDIRNAGSAAEMSLEDGSHWNWKYEEKTFNIVIPHIFSER
jgi:hypothetical protein